ncbi:MAG: HAMP domain-containing protein [Actinobacteria bacterium]|nr:HAMP domain-containing protein [Actinomycetota bacterium]
MRFLPATRRLGLRARLTLIFALGAALLSAILSVTTWELTRENLLLQRLDAARQSAIANATFVSKELKLPRAADASNFEKLLTSLPTPEGAQPVISYNQDVGGKPAAYAKDPLQFGLNDLPEKLRVTVTSGQAATMRYYARKDNNPYLAVGIPIASSNASYYEAVPLQDVENALDGLGISLLGAAALTTLAGGLFGFWISRRALAPLTEVGTAAGAIAGGRLDTRLEVSGDPDLDTLTVSFNEMAAALESRLDRDARFASEVSHELRSPLMTLAASIEVLENSRDEMPERARTALDLMRADVERFQQLVEDLLEISRFDVGAITLHLDEVLVVDFVIQAVGAAGAGGIKVIYDEDVGEAVVRLDKRRFVRVIANLLDNAAKYAGGATSIQIQLASRNAGEGGQSHEVVRIAVEDSGHGVPADERTMIFDRFSRGGEGGNRGADSGVGLGLALVDEHVRLHGGTVWVEDRLDGKAGARFVIELPAVPESEPHLAEPVAV